MLGHPATGSPKSKARTTTTMMPMNAMRQQKTPRKEESASGTVENPAIPSMEYLNNDQKFHFVFPAAHSIFSYEIQWVLNPTHEKIPLEKRLYSLNDKTASTNFLVMKRKSRAPSTISVPDILLMIR